MSEEVKTTKDITLMSPGEIGYFTRGDHVKAFTKLSSKYMCQVVGYYDTIEDYLKENKDE